MALCEKKIEVEEDLLIDFDKAANQNQKPGDQVLTDFMQDYVLKARVEQRQIRQEAIEYANASVRLEGFELSERDQELGQLYIQGEIDSDGLREEHEPRDR